ncbi:MAG TPA: hypothetical protein PKN50_17050, partial [Spirochaetota bacterium]|nr:hypothetical protein [Spirochaetota bacterium]
GDESDALLVDMTIDRVAGNAVRLLDSGAGDAGDSERERRLVMRKTFAATDREGLLWHASGCLVLHVAAGQSSFYLLVREDIENNLLLAMKDKAFRKTAWSLAQSAYDPAAPQPAAGASLRIERPKEFMAGNLALPQVAAFDRFRVRSVFKSVTAGSAGAGQFRNGLWIHMFLTAGGTEINIYCLVAGLTRNDFTERFGDPGGFFKNIVKETVLFLRTAFPGVDVTSVKLAVDSMPDEGAVARSLLLEGELVVNYARMEMVLCVPGAYFSLLFPRALKPWDYRLCDDSPADFLAAVLALNSALFNSTIGTFMKKYRGGLAYLPANTTCIPLYELMDLMDDRDLRLLLQNILVPKYSAGIAKFFNIGVQVKIQGEEGDEGPRVKIFQVAYDRERINRMVPPLIAGEMERLKDYTPAEEYDSFNKAILKEISKSISAGAVMFSYKTRYIFMHEIFDIINEEEARRLGELRSQGIPFERMRRLSNSDLVNFVNRIGNRDFCLSVIDSDGDIPLLMNCMSRSRKRQFMDDLEYYRRQLAGGRLAAEDIIAAKLRISSLLEKKRAAGI